MADIGTQMYSVCSNETFANATGMKFPVTNSQIFIAGLAALLIIVVLVLVINMIITRRPSKGKFSDILREDDWYPSLARFQFLIWTLIISFGYLFIYLIRFLGGTDAVLAAFPANLLILMGISVGVPIVSGGISTIKYPVENPEIRPSKLPAFSKMLMEKDKLSLTRFQMFLWTFLGVAIYAGYLIMAVWTNAGNVYCLSLPDIDPTLVILMGLSQTGYIGGKLLITTSPVSVQDFIFGRAGKGEEVSIFGSGFGDVQDTVWLNRERIPVEKIKNWADGRIDFVLPDQFENAKSFTIQVACGGQRSIPKEFKNLAISDPVSGNN